MPIISGFLRFTWSISLAFLGLIAFSLLSIISQLLLSMVTAVISIVSGIIATLNSLLFSDNESFLFKLIFLALGAALIVPIVTLLLIGSGIGSLFNCVGNLIEKAQIGFNAGFTNGFLGIRNAYIATSFFSAFTLFMRRLFADCQDSRQINSQEFENLHESEFESPPPESFIDEEKHFNLEENTPLETIKLLSVEELQAAKNWYSAENLQQYSNEPIIKKLLQKLLLKTDQYENLFTRLDELRQALIANNLSDIEDQVIPYTDIEIPILFEKQYQKNNQWRAFESLSYITNKTTLLKWLSLHNTHPLNRENVLNPQDFNNMPTRYRWHNLSKNHCSCKELIEGAQKIRKLTSKLQKLLEVTNQPSSPTFFKDTKIKNTDSIEADTSCTIENN